MRSERGEVAKSHRALFAVVEFRFTLNVIRQMKNFHQGTVVLKVTVATCQESPILGKTEGKRRRGQQRM